MKRLVILMCACFILVLSGCSTSGEKSSTEVNEDVSASLSCIEIENENYPYTVELEEFPGIKISAKSEDVLNELLSLIIHSELNQTLSESAYFDDAEDTENRIYNAGEKAYVETEYGNYYFSVKEVTILPKTSARDAVYQITWEYENESFISENGTLLCVNSNSLSVTDSNGYVVSPMSSGWEGDWENSDTPIDVGKKCISKFTYVINDEACAYLDVCLAARNVSFCVDITSGEDTSSQENAASENSGFEQNNEQGCEEDETAPEIILPTVPAEEMVYGTISDFIDSYNTLAIGFQLTRGIDIPAVDVSKMEDGVIDIGNNMRFEFNQGREDKSPDAPVEVANIACLDTSLMEDTTLGELQLLCFLNASLPELYSDQFDALVEYIAGNGDSPDVGSVKYRNYAFGSVMLVQVEYEPR